MPVNAKKKRSNIRQVVLLILVCFLLAGGYALLAKKVYAGSYVKAHFVRPDGSKSPKFNLEIAKSPAERQKGLMFRKPGEMKESEGMIFVFPKQVVQSFWMKNTYIALDMLFINSKLDVVGLIRDVPILNEEQRSVKRPSKYVVEFLAGVTKKYNINDGDKLVLTHKIDS